MAAKKLEMTPAELQEVVDRAVAAALKAKAASDLANPVARATAAFSPDIQEKKLVRPPSARALPTVPETPTKGPVRARMDLEGAPPDPGPAPKPGTDIVRYEGEIWCPAFDRPGAADCQEHFAVKFDETKGVYRGFCPKHTEVAVCEGGVLEGLKVAG